MPDAVLALRLGGPLQAWGSSSQFNRRETDDRPTKSGIVGLLAAAQGRRRVDPIDDLVSLSLGVRVDQPGTMLRDFHTVSDFRGRPLLSAKTNAHGLQTPAGKKPTHVTQRFYLQDAIFVAAVCGDRDLLIGLADAVRSPAFPLALGRRACVPTQPIVVGSQQSDLWEESLLDTLAAIPWQSSPHSPSRRRETGHATVRLPISFDDPGGDDLRTDVPTTFVPAGRRMRSRRVAHGWVDAPTGQSQPADHEDFHNPFALLEG